MIVTRYHDISCGHRIVGHPGKCRLIHGHNYRIHFHCEGDIAHLGMVVDFGVIKATMCEWLEKNWDHKLLLWNEDPILDDLKSIVDKYDTMGSVETVSFNPTAENMAQYLLELGPILLPGSVKLKSVLVEETRKCSALAEC